MDFQPLTETITLPSGIKATIREMTGEDEDLLMNEKLVKAGKAQNQLLGNLLVDLDGKKPTGQDVMQMYSADRTAVMLHARAISFGPEITGTHVCENDDCKADIQVALDHVVKDLEYRKPGPNFAEFDVTLPSGKVAVMRPMRGSDEARLLTARQKGELMTELIFTRLISVGEVEERNDLRRWLKSAPMRDRSALRAALEENEFGYQTQVNVTCPVCQHEQRVDVMGMKDFFFPEM